MSRVKFRTGTESKITSLNSSKTAEDGALYVATNTGTMWLGMSDGQVMQIRDNIDTKYAEATQSAAGLMSAADKKTLDDISSRVDDLSMGFVSDDAMVTYIQTGSLPDTAVTTAKKAVFTTTDDVIDNLN